MRWASSSTPPCRAGVHPRYSKLSPLRELAGVDHCLVAATGLKQRRTGNLPRMTQLVGPQNAAPAERSRPRDEKRLDAKGERRESGLINRSEKSRSTG